MWVNFGTAAEFIARSAILTRSGGSSLLAAAFLTQDVEKRSVKDALGGASEALRGEDGAFPYMKLTEPEGVTG